MGDLIDIDPQPGSETILTEPALAFIEGLQQTFGARRDTIVAARATRQDRLNRGERPAFLADTEPIRAGDWVVTAPPKDLEDRRCEMTGPVTAEALVSGLNSEARTYLADFEDSTSPTWANVIAGHNNVRAAYSRTLTATINGQEAHLNDEPAVLVTRPRGLHLDERHLVLDGVPVAASFVDFGLVAFHNARVALDQGSGLYVYLPKIESHSEARMWNDIFDYTELALGLDPGAIRVGVLIETMPAAFEMDEILYELRTRAVGLIAGRWDYLFSVAKKMREHKGYNLPDRDGVTITTPFMRSLSELLVATCHRRGTHAIGGMSAVVPDADQPDRTKAAIDQIRADKRREAGDGFDGSWVAHGGLVDLVSGEFSRVLGNEPNQVERQRDDVYITPGDLTAIASTNGEATEAGLRSNINVGIRYLAAWLAGTGSVVIDDYVEDASALEISRAQVWQWIRHEVVMSNGQMVTRDLVERNIDEVLADIRASLAPEEWTIGRYDDARKLFESVVLADDFADFITVAAYEQL